MTPELVSWFSLGFFFSRFHLRFAVSDCYWRQFAKETNVFRRSNRLRGLSSLTVWFVRLKASGSERVISRNAKTVRIVGEPLSYTVLLSVPHTTYRFQIYHGVPSVRLGYVRRFSITLVDVRNERHICSYRTHREQRRKFCFWPSENDGYYYNFSSKRLEICKKKRFDFQKKNSNGSGNNSVIGLRFQ